jgi:glucokinase
MNETLVGIDLGGSTLKAVCTDSAGRVLREHVASAGGLIPQDTLVAKIREAIEVVSPESYPSRIGMALGGAIQPDGTMLPTSTNLPNIANLPLVVFFEKEISCKIRVENDARTAMRGEAWSGAAKSVRSAMTITFGTGIGCGLMIDGKIVEGANGRAGEIGVWKLNDQDRDGNWPSYEDTAAPGRVERKTGKRFRDMFASDEATAMIALTGRAIANAHLLLDLEMAVLLGGITELGEPLRIAVDSAFRKACQEDYQPGFEIRLGQLGTLAGAVGAAALWRTA